MNKQTALAAYKRTAQEWLTLDPKGKAKKILACLKGIEPESVEQRKALDDQILMIEELEPEEIEDHLNLIHAELMKNARRDLGLDENEVG